MASVSSAGPVSGGKEDSGRLGENYGNLPAKSTSQDTRKETEKSPACGSRDDGGRRRERSHGRGRKHADKSPRRGDSREVKRKKERGHHSGRKPDDSRRDTK